MTVFLRIISDQTVLVFKGYFIFIIARNDILQRVLRAVTKNGENMFPINAI